MQRRNAYLKGKIEAFRDFAEILEEEMGKAGVGVDDMDDIAGRGEGEERAEEVEKGEVKVEG